MPDKKGAKIIIIDLSTKKQNIQYNYSLIIIKRI